MKRLLTLFLVIGVMGIYGQTTETEIQADTTQQADIIIQGDTIRPKNLQVEGDTASSIKDSLFTEEIKKDQQEIIEKKDNSVSCCLIGKNHPEQKSKWSFGIGYCNETSFRLGALTVAWESNDVPAPPWPEDFPFIVSNGIICSFKSKLNSCFIQGLNLTVLKSFTLHKNKFLNCEINDSIELIGNDYDLYNLNLNYMASSKIVELSCGLTYALGFQNLLQGYWDEWDEGNYRQVVTNRIEINRQYLGPNIELGFNILIKKIEFRAGLAYAYLTQIYVETTNSLISDLGKMPIQKVGTYFSIIYRF